MTTFERWKQRYDNGFATLVQIQRLVDAGIITQQEYDSYDWPPLEHDPLEKWRQRADCTRLQAKIALENAGLLDTIETFMADPETPTVAKLAWKEAYRFSRRSQLFDLLGPEFGMTPEQIDDLFIAAQAVEV